ncbi:thioesterase [Actinoplanes sp. LDG1-06]|uniref:Thioesterase n=1 Tax=Paractinoplanes ovalisporus TaxID=2810368 RepID=A0ABS2AI44_9ACTN|nr:alpha/beta fold hydrolase [Actinoplanes ovalisporus]MBM2619511.1 thioesterase [Actinoplanes ovalisporus]
MTVKYRQPEAGAVTVPFPRPAATRSLVCLSFCGGGTASFRAWQPALPDDVELVLIGYPGRESRFSSPFARDWEELAVDVAEAVTSVAGLRPYILCGHSMGGWMAFDVASRMERDGAGPRSLVVSGAPTPQLWVEERSRQPDPGSPAPVLLDWMRAVGQVSEEALADPDLQAIALEVLRADLRVLKSYRYRGEVVDAPIRVLYGVEDDEIDEVGVRGWSKLTTGDTHIEELPGGHFYTPPLWARLPQHLGLAPAECP